MNQQKQPWYLSPGSVRVTLVVLVALTVLNVWMVWTVGKVWDRVQLLPTHFPSSPSTHVNLAPLVTGVWQSYSEIISSDIGETVTVAIHIRLAERVPSYELLVRYRAWEREVSHEWLIVEPELVDGLEYRAFVELDPEANYEYQIMQTLQGEIVRLTHEHYIRLAEEIGSPDVSVYIGTDPRVGKTRFRFSQHRHPQLEAWRVERVTVKLDNVADAVVALWLDPYDNTVEVDTRLWEAAKKAEFTVYYQDGEVRSVSFELGAHRPDPLVIRRN